MSLIDERLGHAEASSSPSCRHGRHRCRLCQLAVCILHLPATLAAMQVTAGTGLEVRQDSGGGKGRGVFATQVRRSAACTGVGRSTGGLAQRTRLCLQAHACAFSGILCACPPTLQAFKAGQVLFREPPLAAIQHSENRAGAGSGVRSGAGRGARPRRERFFRRRRRGTC